MTYRNKKDFLTPDNFTIDEGSLWENKEGILVLVDEDNYVETELDLSLFEASKE